jgi:hypothetical protein
MTAKPTVYVVGATKGGVGKTVTTRTLLAYFEDHGIAYKAYDTEPAPGVLARYHPTETTVVDLTKSEGQMAVFDNLSTAHVSVIDCKAALLEDTLILLRDTGMLEMVEAGTINVVVLHIMGATTSSFEEIERVGAIMGPKIKHFLVLNHINDTEYWGWDSPEAQAIITKVSGGVIDIPKCDEMAMEAVGAKFAKFSVFAKDLSDGFILPGKVGSWMRKVSGNFVGKSLTAE